MNWAQCKDPVSYKYCCTVVVFWSLTQNVAGASPFEKRQIIVSLNSVRTEPGTSDSKSNTLLSELTWHVLLGGIFKLSSVQTVSDLESEVLG